MTTKTIASLTLALILTASIATGADARSRQKTKHRSGDSLAVTLLKKQAAELAALRHELADIRKLLRPQIIASIDPEPLAVEPPRNPVAIAPMPIPDVTAKTLAGYERAITRSTKLKDLTPVLRSTVARIIGSCPGARLTSGYRRGARVAGSGRSSLHSRYPSRAADLAGNPSCIRRQLANWKGGLSTDYNAVRHYHVSYDPKGREWGQRFAHYGSRYARHHRRYAAVR